MYFTNALLSHTFITIWPSANLGYPTTILHNCS